jgi:DNA primase
LAISSAFIDRLLGNVNIIDVIGRRITLERRGGAYWAKCPFHGSGEERTASFKVYDQTGTYHCFSCKESGNAIHFVRKFDGLDFTEAVELLASQVGMEVPKYEAKIDTSNASEINRSALQVFFDQLKSDKGKKAVNYLKERGISGEIAKIFSIGYATSSKPTLHEKLSSKFEEIDLEESGLFGKNDNGDFYDRFRDRVMFPIRNIKGECIAFGGRLLEDKKDQAKYLNSPETKTYKKKYELYGLYESREINKRPDSLFLVEGYMDVIGLFQSGIKNAVASSGTAFTQEQFRKILNYTNTLYIVFDGDEAGQKASWRAVENALPLIREDLESGEDPDSYVRKNGKEAFMNLAKNSMTFSDYFLDTIKNQDDLSSIEGRSVVAKFALPLVNKITNATLKEAYVNEISNICDLDFAKLIKGEKKNIVPATIKEQNTETKSSSVLRKSILNIFMSLIQHPKLASSGEFNQIRSNSRFSFLNEVKDIYIQNHDISASVLMEKISNDKIKNIFGEALVSEIQLSESDASSMLKDCIDFISQNESEREEVLKDKYSMQELSSAEKRELQQIILKKDRMSQEEAALIKNLSSK